MGKFASVKPKVSKYSQTVGSSADFIRSFGSRNVMITSEFSIPVRGYKVLLHVSIFNGINVLGPTTRISLTPFLSGNFRNGPSNANISDNGDCGLKLPLFLFIVNLVMLESDVRDDRLQLNHANLISH